MDWFLYDNGLRHERIKEDNSVVKSENHKIYAGSPQSSNASRARKSADSDEISQVGQKVKKVHILAKYVIIRNNIKSDLQLCALAQSEIDDGKHDFAIFFCINKTEKNRNEIIKTSWEMQNGKVKIKRMNKTRMDI